MKYAEAVAAGEPPGKPLVVGGDVLRRVAWRLLPFLCLLYLLNILDRANVAFARLTMQGDLDMSDEAFSFGYGIFYFGYLVFEVPANLLLRRVGARRWIARIMISWGLVTCLTATVTGVWSFYAVRILLGIAEAGFFPGIVLYLTYWFPARERARAMALFMLASPLGGALGNPISGAVMQYLDGALGLSGWQWIFLVEGLPSVLVGIWVLSYLPDDPTQARWLGPDERSWLVERLNAEDPARRVYHAAHLGRAFTDPHVWLLIAVYFTVAVGSNAAGAKFPQLISNQFRDASKLTIGLFAALPSICGVIAMIVLGINSDRTGERRGHVAFGAFAGAAGWTLALYSPSPWLTLVGFCVAQAGMMSMLPTFWAIPTAFLSGAAAAGGIALINSVGNIGGLFGPNIYERFGMPAMALVLCAGGLLVLFARRDATRS
jgi:ACS family tartrate transporter-like MFS transporter